MSSTENHHGNTYDPILNAVTVADIFDYHSRQYKINSKNIGRCRCPFCQADDATAFFFDKKASRCFLCESRAGVIELEMFLACVNTADQAAMLIARRHNISVDWPKDQRENRRGLVHFSQLLPPMASSSKLLRKAWDRAIQNVKTIRDSKAKTLSELIARWEDGKPKSESEKALECDLRKEIHAFDKRLSEMWVESNVAVATLRIQERGGNNE